MTSDSLRSQDVVAKAPELIKRLETVYGFDDVPQFVVRDCQLAADALREAVQFIEGFAHSAESGFARQRAALAWLRKVNT